MLKLYTDKTLIKGDLILSNEAFFARNGITQAIMENPEPYLKVISNILETAGNLAKTQLGWTHIAKLSTGFKVLYNMVYCHQNALPTTMNLTECGPNVLNAAFSLADTVDLPVYLDHDQLWGCEDREFLVDGKIRFSTIKDLLNYL